MTKTKRRIMRALKINEISAVDKPAQQDATVTIMKRDDTVIEYDNGVKLLSGLLPLATNHDATSKGQTETTMTDFYKTHSDVAELLDHIVESNRLKGESYSDATTRLSRDAGAVGQQYRKCAAIADTAHRSAAGGPSQEQLAEVAKSFSQPQPVIMKDGNPIQTITKSDAESQMDRLTAELRTHEPTLDYFSAYSKVMELHPELYSKAVGN